MATVEPEGSVRRVIGVALDALCLFPGLSTPAAGGKLALAGRDFVAKILEKKQAGQALSRALQRANSDFHRAAESRGWGPNVVEKFLSQLCNNNEVLREALLSALRGADATALEESVAKLLDLPDLSPKDTAEACHQYARCVWARLWGEPAFRDPVRDIFLREHIQLLEEVSARLDRLVETLPSQVVDEQERRAQARAWEALHPVIAPYPECLTPENLLESLRAPLRLVDFVGDEPRSLVAELAESLKALVPEANRAWILWGPGGIGKTRLAVELAWILEDDGWQSFFVPTSSDIPDWRTNACVWARPERATLLIVDDAEQRTRDELETLARAIGQATRKRSHPLGLVLLMRPNPGEPVAGHVLGALKMVGLSYETRAVPLLRKPDDRSTLFHQSRALFRKNLTPSDAPREVDYKPEELPQSPLSILALAVLAANGHRVAHSRDETAVLTDLWERWEQARWQRTLQAQGGGELLSTPEVWAEACQRIEQALVAATLGRPFRGADQVATWWEEHFPFQACTAGGEKLDARWLARRLVSLFPVPEGEENWFLQPVMPDPLGELLVARQGQALGSIVSAILPTQKETEAAFEASEQLWVEKFKTLENFDAWLTEREDLRSYEESKEVFHEMLFRPLELIAQERSAVEWPIRVLLKLDRLSQEGDTTAREATKAGLGAFATWLETTARGFPKKRLFGWLYSWWDTHLQPRPYGFQEPSHDMAEFQVRFYTLWTELADDDMAERARGFFMLGLALRSLGSRDEGVEAIRQAVKGFRQLSADDVPEIQHYLAEGLEQLAKTLVEQDCHDEALALNLEEIVLRSYLASKYDKPLSDLTFMKPSWELDVRLYEVARQVLNLCVEADIPPNALEVARVSAEIARKQAEQALLIALHAHAALLQKAGALEEARRVFVEGLQQFLDSTFWKDYWYDDASELLVGYLDACNSAGVEPDTTLVRRVQDELDLRKLEQGQPLSSDDKQIDRL